MDTTTVLKIIEMIDDRLQKNSMDFNSVPWEEMPDEVYYRSIGEESGLTELKDHLQSFIEAQLNAEENKTGE